jgi:hypothetical protein
MQTTHKKKEFIVIYKAYSNKCNTDLIAIFTVFSIVKNNSLISHLKEVGQKETLACSNW